MTLRHMDGMGLYSSYAQANQIGKWDYASNSSSGTIFRAAGAFPNSYAVAYSNNQANLCKYFGSWLSGTNPIIVGVRMKMTSTQGGGYVFGFQYSGRIAATFGGQNAFGSIAFMQTSFTSTITVNTPVDTNGTAATGVTYSVGSSAGWSGSIGAWDYYEFKLWPGASGTTGWRLQVRRNATVIIDLTWNFTNATVIDYYSLGFSQSGWSPGISFSDFYICDSSGTINNDYLGDTRVETLYPSGDGAHTGFGIGAPANLLTTNQWGVESGTTGWAFRGSAEATAIAAAGPAMAGTQASIASSTTYAYEGTHSLALTGSGGNTAWQTPGGTSGVAVTPNAAYSFAARVYPQPTISNVARVGVVWYDSGGTVISANISGLFGQNTTIGDVPQWVLATGTWTAPSTAAFAAMFLEQEYSTAPLYWDTMGMYAGSVPSFRAPSSTTHFDQVNESTHDSDASYVVTSTVGATDSYALADLNSTTGTPVAVLATSVVRKETPTARTASNLLRLSATDYVGTAFTVNNDLAYHGMTTIWETNPATSTTWTISNVNALEAGIQLES